MSILTNRGAASDSAFAPAASKEALHGVFSFVNKILVARRQRIQLLSLDDRMLADIGISRADAYREAARSPFDVALSRR